MVHWLSGNLQDWEVCNPVLNLCGASQLIPWELASSETPPQCIHWCKRFHHSECRAHAITSHSICNTRALMGNTLWCLWWGSAYAGTPWLLTLGRRQKGSSQGMRLPCRPELLALVWLKDGPSSQLPLRVLGKSWQSWPLSVHPFLTDFEFSETWPLLAHQTESVRREAEQRVLSNVF